MLVCVVLLIVSIVNNAKTPKTRDGTYHDMRDTMMTNANELDVCRVTSQLMLSSQLLSSSVIDKH